MKKYVGNRVWRGSVLLLWPAGGRSHFFDGRPAVSGVSSPGPAAVVQLAPRLSVLGLGGWIPAACRDSGTGAAGRASSSSSSSPGFLAE